MEANLNLAIVDRVDRLDRENMVDTSVIILLVLLLLVGGAAIYFGVVWRQCENKPIPTCPTCPVCPTGETCEKCPDCPPAPAVPSPLGSYQYLIDTGADQDPSKPLLGELQGTLADCARACSADANCQSFGIEQNAMYQGRVKCWFRNTSDDRFRIARPGSSLLVKTHTA